MKQTILVTPGEPAGIGPDVIIEVAQQESLAEFAVVADPDLMQQRAEQLNLPLQLIKYDFHTQTTPHQPGTLKIIPVTLNTPATPGVLNTVNADYVLRTLEQATSLCKINLANAIVTGPVHKGIMNDAGIPFTGHTEFFADYCGVKHTVMLFVIDELKVALATTHLALKNVSKAITKKRLRTVLSILNDELKKYFQISEPKILVCGLNPHAGENGYLGREEIDTIAPLLDELRAENYLVEGPLPADTIFTQKYLQRADAVLAMYHDQALPLIKYIGFDRAVNVTLGLPFVRTSVDHGTALDIAGTGKANAGSMKAALHLAEKLSSR